MGKWKGGISYQKNICKQCSNLFMGKHSRKFCSRGCYSLFRSKYYVGPKSPQWKGGRMNQRKKCRECKKVFWGYKTRKFCSLKCKRINSSRVFSGKNSWAWKGGKYFDKDGYLCVMVKSHPFANKMGYVLHHRLVIEKKIKRYLSKNEVVHHINGTVSDNRISNLLLLTKQEHDRLHRYLRYKNTG